MHLDWDVPASVIAEGFTYGFAPIAIPSIDPLVAQTRTDEVRRMIGAFAGARPELMHRMPDAATERGRAWPSPRSWEFASLLVGHARAAGASKGVARLLLSGCVGKSAANEFLAWERALDLPNVETALRNNGVIEVPATPDRVVAMCGGLVAAVKQDPTKQRCAAAVNGILVAVAVAGHVDLATVALRRIASEVKAAGAALSPEAVAHFGGILSRMGTLKASA